MIPITATARLAAGVVTSLSVGKVVSEVIKNNVTPTSNLDRTMVQVGGAALSMVIAGAAVSRVEGMVTDIAAKVRKAQEEIDTSS